MLGNYEAAGRELRAAQAAGVPAEVDRLLRARVLIGAVRSVGARRATAEEKRAAAERRRRAAEESEGGLRETIKEGEAERQAVTVRMEKMRMMRERSQIQIRWQIWTKGKVKSDSHGDESGDTASSS